MRRSGYVGIDVAKAKLYVFIGRTGESFSVINTDLEVRRMLKRFGPDDFVILEATGGLEAPVASVLAAAGIAVAIVNPRQVRDFARATGRLAKTDRLDAEVLARFGEAVKPAARPLADEQAAALEALVTRRRQLVEMLTAEKNRRSMAPKVLHRSIDEHIRWLERRLSGFDEELSTVIRNTPLWRERDELLRSVPCVGRCCRARCSHRCPSWEDSIASRSPPWLAWRPSTVIVAACAAAVASGAGVPRSGECCTWRRWRESAAIPLSEPSICGCAPVVSMPALTACMRKLLVILNAMMRTKTHWQIPALATPPSAISPLLGAVSEHGCC